MCNVKDAVKTAGAQAEYDTKAKMLLAYKPVLANILVRSVEEFNGMNPQEVEKLIEGEPQVGCVPVEEGFTNSEEKHEENGVLIRGMNNESNINNEGKIFFDVIFYVRTPDGRTKIIINVESQRNDPTDYDVEMRGIFYAAREISSQKERDFVKSNYNDIKKVYSIWICMNSAEQSMNHIHLENRDVIGTSRWKESYDLLNVVIIRLPQKLVGRTHENELHRLLGAIFLPDLESEEKVIIMETEYNMLMSDNVREELNDMCNLSQGILENGINIGAKELLQAQSLIRQGYDTVDKLIQQGISKNIAELAIQATFSAV